LKRAERKSTQNAKGLSLTVSWYESNTAIAHDNDAALVSSMITALLPVCHEPRLPKGAISPSERCALTQILNWPHMYTWLTITIARHTCKHEVEGGARPNNKRHGIQFTYDAKVPRSLKIRDSRVHLVPVESIYETRTVKQNKGFRVKHAKIQNVNCSCSVTCSIMFIKFT